MYRLVGDVEGRNNKAPNEEINRPAEAKKRSINLTKGTTETDKIIQNLEILIPDFKTAGIDLLSVSFIIINNFHDLVIDFKYHFILH